MKKSIPGFKDDNGIYAPIPKEPELKSSAPEVMDLSIDSMMREVLINIYGILRAIKVDVGTGIPSRESVQNLKDCAMMLKDLKKDEKDFLDSLTDEQLKELK